MRKLRIGLAIITVVSCLNAGAALALRCGDQLVSLGDSKVEVSAKCGEPMLRTQHNESVEETDGTTKHRFTKSIDEWTFNFGPSEFIYFLRFENGQLADLRSGGYGSAKGSSLDSCRHGQLLSMGDSIGEALLKCGEPALKEQREDKIIETVSNKTKRRESVVINDWTYNFGPKNFLYFLRFENGRIKEITTGGYGY